MPTVQEKAKVFISCGQRRDSGEVDIAKRIAEKLEEDLGFQTYIAVQEQSLNGVKENIFRQIETSEYFLFIDFKRERLAESDSKECRGSLFSHQELALASYLGIEVIALQEKGVKKRDGLMEFLQANTIPFCKRASLPDRVASEVRKRGWRPDWKNELSLNSQSLRRAEVLFDDPLFTGNQPAKTSFFHVPVTNRHPRKVAVGCSVYLVDARDVQRDASIPIEIIEFQWAGFTHPYVNIPPAQSRYFDALLVVHQGPLRPQFNPLTASAQYRPKISGPGDYELTYVVVSQTFRPARATFRLHVDVSGENISFNPVT